MVFLRSDRYLEFHSKTGAGYYHTRVPRVGRDLIYDQRACELIVAGNSSEVFRLNLEIGSFLKPFQTSQTTMNVWH
jgi:ribosome biogenesis protein ENP2